jgi:hypothetical protein
MIPELDTRLFCAVQETNLRRLDLLHVLAQRLSEGDLTSAPAALRSLHRSFGARVELVDLSEVGAVEELEGFDVPADGVEAFIRLIEEHPAFEAGGMPEAVLPVIGPAVQPGDAPLDEARRDVAELLGAGALALSQLDGPTDRYADALVHIGVAPDALSGLLRDVLLGRPIPEPGGLHVPPKQLFDAAQDIARRTCLVGLGHALSEWGQAAASNRTDAWATGISGLNPPRGCAGTQVTISGSGFGAAKPADADVWFAKAGGGCTRAVHVPPWSDTQVVVTAPSDVGPGCVGFVRLPSNPTPMAEAASNLAGQMVECIGAAAIGAAGRIETRGSLPILKCPPCLPGDVNYFAGGPPEVRSFTANGWSDEVEIAPGAKLDLAWSVVNATSVEISRILVPGQTNEHPAVSGPLNPTNGIHSFPSVPGTFSWDREYELRARNACIPTGSPVTKRVKVLMRSRPDLTVGGIEATQGIQFFAANVHMLNPNARRPDNDVALLAGKPTIVRVFVDSGQLASFEAGMVSGVRARLHGRDGAGTSLPGSPIAPLNPSVSPDPTHSISARRRAPVPTEIAAERMLPANRSFLFLLPASWTGVGTIDVRAEVLMPSGVPERDARNNTFTQTLRFNRGGLPIRLAVLRVRFTDPGTGASVAPPNLFQVLAETDRIQRVYPSNRSLLSVVPAPGTNPWTYGGSLTAPGISCGAGWNDILAELILRAFFTLGMEDRVWVALLDGTGIAPGGPNLPASGCGGPIGSMGLAYLGAGLLAGILVGPLAAVALARLGTCAVGIAGALIGTPPAGPPVGVGTLEQEIGHAFARFHIPGGGAPPLFEAGWPDYQGGAPFTSIGEFGLEIDDLFGLPPTLRAHSPRTFPVFPTPSHDLMSYFGPSWVSPFIYERLMTGPTAPPVQPPAPAPGPPSASAEHEHSEKPEEEHDDHEEHGHPGEINDPSELFDIEPSDVALVRGSILHEGATLFPVYVQRRGVRLRPVTEETPYRVQLRDAGEMVLTENGVVPLAEQHTGDVEPDFLFALVLPWDDRTARVTLVRGEEELLGIRVSPEPPRLSPPNVEQSARGLVVEWEADSVDGMELRYLVRYAVDGERMWQLVAADLTEPRIEIPDGTLPGGSHARFQVAASAGGRTVWQESEPFEALPSIPETVVLAPSDGATVPAGEEISLRGEAMVLEGGLVEDASLSWRSSVGGELGTGHHVRVRLPPGEHTIEMVATSPLGPEASESVRVTAGELTEPNAR